MKFLRVTEQWSKVKITWIITCMERYGCHIISVKWKIVSFFTVKKLTIFHFTLVMFSIFRHSNETNTNLLSIHTVGMERIDKF